MMDFKKFEAILHLRKEMHFTGIELQHRENKSEFYALGMNNHTQSQLYICTLSNESSSQAQLKQFRTWLHRFNIDRAKQKAALLKKE
ncbi:MAG TPA: hypothetical protein DEO73_14570 [Pantoea sp.]|uniref:Uncharacterized protein n=2 Tax=Erwiniaceae TaxID=1903409 RepID=A0A286BM74_9GAMM|nr:hypothetical protein BX596_1847 [Enterobacteriaceae bacterium JKS000233]SOD35233.1 hypothetical protein SAMN06273570_0170 [Pantoea floridensis]HBZ16972.1 hypothetical protein [Pantoea sp.]